MYIKVKTKATRNFSYVLLRTQTLNTKIFLLQTKRETDAFSSFFTSLFILVRFYDTFITFVVVFIWSITTTLLLLFSAFWGEPL